jgi:putative resolvase
MKLSVWAEQNGISYQTAWNWFTTGKLPVPAIQTATGTILVKEDVERSRSTVIYARVSSSDQRADLDRQVARLSAYAAQNGQLVAQVVCEVGSGMNGKRPKLLKVLKDPSIQAILVEHRDRLTRFGLEFLEATLSAQGRSVIVAEAKELDEDLVRDMTEVLTSFGARLYGRRSAKHRATAAISMLTTSQTK